MSGRVRRADLEHMHEQRCCWNCGADAWHEPSEQPPFDPQGAAGLFEAMVICHEPRCPIADKYGDYADPVLKESDWHPVALACPAWVSAEGIFPASRIVPVLVRPAIGGSSGRDAIIESGRGDHGAA